MPHPDVRLVLPAQASPPLGSVALLDVDHEAVRVVRRQHHEHVVQLPVEYGRLLVQVQRVDHHVVHSLGSPEHLLHLRVSGARERFEHEPELPPALAPAVEAVRLAERPRVDCASECGRDRRGGCGVGPQELYLESGLAESRLRRFAALRLTGERLLLLTKGADHFLVLRLESREVLDQLLHSVTLRGVPVPWCCGSRASLAYATAAEEPPVRCPRPRLRSRRCGVRDRG